MQFGDSSSSGGISSLGLNLKSFIFQLVTFLIVLAILRRWVFPKLVATLEERRKVLAASLEHAKQTEETLQKADSKSNEILHRARLQADQSLADAKDQAKQIIAAAENNADVAAARITTEAQEQLGRERSKLRSELRDELADLVVQTTEKVIRKRLSATEDLELIRTSVGELER